MISLSLFWASVTNRSKCVTVKTKDNWKPGGKKTNHAAIQRALKQNESKVAAEENEGQQGGSSHHRESTAYLKKMHCNL